MEPAMVDATSLPAELKKDEMDSTVLGCGLTDVCEKYELLEVIGQGTYGLVRKCRHRSTGQLFAVKTIPKNKVPDLELLRKEVDLLRQVDHPNIIKLYETLEDEKKLHLITELCTGGELYDRIIEKSNSPQHHFSEGEAAQILRNILDAIAYCHEEKNICHRDLKVENFLLLNESVDSPVKIIDFGLAKSNPDNVMTSRVGTVYYVAPEVVLANEYTNKCDIWSIGIIAYVLLCGFPPFHAENEAKTLEMVKKAPIKFPSPHWDNVSHEAKAFISRLLNRNPVERPSAKEALQDPWINQQHLSTPASRHSGMLSFSFMSLFSSSNTSATSTSTRTATGPSPLIDCKDETDTNMTSPIPVDKHDETSHASTSNHHHPDANHHHHATRPSSSWESTSRFLHLMFGFGKKSKCSDDNSHENDCCLDDKNLPEVQ